MRASYQPVGQSLLASGEFQQIVKDMIAVMRKQKGVGLAAPQLGHALRVIVLEDTEAVIKELCPIEVKQQKRKAFGVKVIHWSHYSHSLPAKFGLQPDFYLCPGHC